MSRIQETPENATIDPLFDANLAEIRPKLKGSAQPQAKELPGYDEKLESRIEHKFQAIANEKTWAARKAALLIAIKEKAKRPLVFVNALERQRMEAAR